MALLEILQPRGYANVTLDGDRLTIGKSDDNDLAIADDPTLSRHHALLERVGAAWSVSDLGAKNGTLVNGQRVVGTQVLKHTDELTLGETRILFRDQASAQGDTTKAKDPPPRLTPAEHEVLVELVRPWGTGERVHAARIGQGDRGTALHHRSRREERLGRLYDKFGIIDGDNNRRVDWPTRLGRVARSGRAISRPATSRGIARMVVFASSVRGGRQDQERRRPLALPRLMTRSSTTRSRSRSSSSMASESRDELLGEVRILLRLTPHSALPTMREGFSLDEDHYAIVMDWIEGQNLADVLDRAGVARPRVEDSGGVRASGRRRARSSPPPQSGDRARRRQAVEPRADAERQCRARRLRDRAPGGDVGRRRARVGYVAPEVWRGEPSSPAADVYGLAATAYALLTGGPPDHTTAARSRSRSRRSRASLMTRSSKVSRPIAVRRPAYRG